MPAGGLAVVLLGLVLGFVKRCHVASTGVKIKMIAIWGLQSMRTVTL